MSKATKARLALWAGRISSAIVVGVLVADGAVQRIVEVGSMVSADEVAQQLGQVMKREVQAFAVPRPGWAAAFEQFGIPKGLTGPAEEMFDAVNAGWMDLGVEGAEQVAGTTSARDVFAAAQGALTP